MLRKILLIFILLLGGQAAALAQSPPVQLKSLQIELWPEFDRPETLVIYRGELGAATALPTKLTFQLPGYVEDFHVVATEQNGVLVEVQRESIEWRKEGDTRLITFSTFSPKFDLEYYDPRILTKEGQQRQLQFDFVAPYPVETATFQVQEPAQAEAFAMTPPSTSTFTGHDGLKYDTVEIAGLGSGEAFKLSAGYKRRTDSLSAELLGSNTAEHAQDLPAVAEAPAPENLILGYILIGVGAVLLLGVGGYWWWSRQTHGVLAQPQPRARRVTSRLKRSNKPKPVESTDQPQPPAASPESTNFCYRCGTPLRDDSNFCHICGAERRR